MSSNYLPFISSFNNNLLSDRFNQIDKMFSRLTGEKPLHNIPNYDFFRKKNGDYELNIVVAGYKEENLNISVQNNKLNISGELKKNNKNKNIKWYHKGIKKKSFSCDFKLSHEIKVKLAILKYGILKIIFNYKIPEKEKTEKITIQKK
ncbi:Hsp20 family protein [Buchnera aphidicola (Taiwanaphis decaspermi)]|uniref:Hsp20 family protein n=1 Tax=Buchnera aphidicola TaxID=9 RepID=UPI0031B7F485